MLREPIELLVRVMTHIIQFHSKIRRNAISRHEIMWIDAQSVADGNGTVFDWAIERTPNAAFRSVVRQKSAWTTYSLDDT